jgi:signal transduction histidine kinase/sensor domain CHASE-containing protein
VNDHDRRSFLHEPQGRGPQPSPSVVPASARPPLTEGSFVAHISTLIVVLAGSALTLLGLVVLLGWYTHNMTLLQLWPRLAPMQYNAALAFLSCGLGLLALLAGRVGTAAACSMITTAIGLMTLAQYLLAVDFGIDQLFIKAFVTVQTSHPGRMAPQLALGFALSGIALLLMRRAVRHEQILLFTGPLGAIVLALGLVACVGYLTGLKTYAWGSLTSMAAHSAVGCTMLGAGIVALTWRQGSSELHLAPQPSAVLVGIGGLTVTLCLWQALLGHQHALVERTVEIAKISVQNEIMAQMKSYILALERLADRWEMWGQPPREVWEADAQLYIRDHPGAQAVAWVDPLFYVQWMMPPDQHAGREDFNLAFEERRRRALELASGSRQVTSTQTLQLLQGGLGFEVYVPVVSKGKFQGLIVGTFRLQELLDAILGNVAARYAIAIFEGSEEIYSRYPPGRQDDLAWSQEAPLGLYGVTWHVRVWPTPALPLEELSALPEMGLGAGLLTAGLLAVAVHLAHTARRRAVQVTSANQALHEEIHEHERTEASLGTRVEQMEAVRTVTLEIARELDLTTLLSLIVQRAVTLLEAAHSGAVYLWDEATQQLIPHAWHGRGDWMQDIRIILGAGIVGSVAQQQKGLMVNDYRNSAYKQFPFMEHHGSTAVMAEPLLYRDRLVGVIVLDNNGTSPPFTDEDRALLSLFATQAAIAIENARLYEALEARFMRLQTLTRLNQVVSSALDTSQVLGEIARAAATLMDAPVVSFWVVDGTTRTLEVQAFSDEGPGTDFPAPKLSFEEDGVGWVAAHCQPLNVADIVTDGRFIALDWWRAYDLHSFFGVPILHDDTLLAVLSLNGRQPFRFRPEDQPLLDSFVAQAAVAIRNAGLFAEIQQRTAHLAQLNAELQNEIAERKRGAEQIQRQQEALFQSEKLAAMGSLLASVAHELNNPLSVVTMQSDLLGDEVADKALAERVRLISQSAERCVRIVQNFLALARQNPPQRTPVELNAVVEEAMQLFSYALQVDNIDLRWQPGGDLPLLWADPHQLQQVVVNLVTNAHQALRESAAPRRLTITTWASPTHTHVYLEVGDTGPGIPREIQERIFEPFFTTKPPGVGTGLGLPYCQGIIEGHRGFITVESSVGRGTIFRIQLPIEAVPAPLPVAPVLEPSPQAEVRAILVVDDEPGITSALAYLLRRDGHAVETAAHGRIALEKLQEHTYDLILCDLRMPELDGPGLYRELEQQYPHLLHRVIFLTGDTLSLETRGFLAEVEVPRLSKPFRAADVRRIVQQALQAL